MAAIVAVHALYGHEVKVKSTVIRDAWAEIRRTKGSAKIPKAALIADDLKKMLDNVPEDRLQERAILLVGFASLMRRSELVALNTDDLEFTLKALNIRIRRSKTDKEGKGDTVAILRTNGVYCPVTALERWLKHAHIDSGAIFLSGRHNRMHPAKVAEIVKQWAGHVGFDKRQVGAHSLRRGGITTMFRNDAKIEDIMRASRHKTVGIALGYIEAQRAQENPAIAAIGL